jgi:predicted dehydrogenase
MKSFRVAIVGTGGIARSHMNALQHEKERAEIVAAVDIAPQSLQSFCEQYEIAHAYADMQTMLDEQKPDLVHISTPPSTHFELAVQALKAGAHVFCEKPLVASLDEVDRLQAVERETGRTCSVVFQWRFGSGAQHLKRLIDNQELGRPLVGICNTTWYRDAAYYQVPWRGKWDTELGGVSMGHGIHAMDMFLWLLGDWVEVSAMIGTLDRDIEVEDVSMAHVRFANGALGSIVNSVLSPRQVSYVRFDFQRATVELEHLYSHSNTHWRFSIPEHSSYQDDLERWRAIGDDVMASHTAQLGHVLDALERGEAPLTSGVQARTTVEFLTALYKSALTRQPITRGSIDQSDPFYYHVYGAEKPSLRATPR